jgi:N-glycosylase/DNA lyase
VERALEEFSGIFGKEAFVELLSIMGRVIEFRFSGSICETCGISDYFEDLAHILEEVSGAPHALWHYEDEGAGFHVWVVRLDFLGELTKEMEEVKPMVEARMRMFRIAGEDEESLFEELCFCILTANYTAEGGMRIQEALGRGFFTLGREELSEELRRLGHRYPEARAEYIVEARRLYGRLRDTLKDMGEMEAREWLVREVKGLGYKEASHFLRNTGSKTLAILDRHILRFLHEKGLITDMPRSLNKRSYMRLEKLMRVMAGRMGITPAELDLYIWYMMTGKILK